MTTSQRALQIWSLLICAASNGRTYSYEELASALGMKRGAARAMGQFLHPIMLYCRRNQLPPLTVLVVRKDTGLPGVGLTQVANASLDRERVFAHDWFRVPLPEEGNLTKAANASAS